MSEKKNARAARLLLLIVLTAVCAAALFFLCYRTDNKYTAPGPQPANGTLVLSGQDLQEHRQVYLTTGWEIYRGRLLAPADFRSGLNLPDEYVFIGQYGGFEGHAENGAAEPDPSEPDPSGTDPSEPDPHGSDANGSGPHGSATYRLNIALPSDIRSYTLELPEIYSAYKLYINGELVLQMGEPDAKGYRAETGNSKVTLRCADRMEMIVAVADYSHSYSGMVYPPAFGETAAVESVLNARFAIRAAAVALSLGVGFLYFGIWLLLRKGRSDLLPLAYAALCFCFALFICYPLVKTLWTSGMSWYALERLSYPAMLLFITCMQSRVCGISGLPAKLLAAVGIFACGWAAAVPFVMGDSLNLMMAYGAVLAAYTWLAGLYLLAASLYGAYKGAAHSAALLTGAVVFGVSLVMDRLLPLFEPIRFGWFSELSGACYVLLIGAVMAGEVAGQFRLRLQLEGRVESVTRMMEVQKAYYPEILLKEEELKAARHDFRHHMAAIRELAAAKDLPKLMAYTQSFDGRVGLKTEASYCEHFVIDMLLRMYAGLALKQDTDFQVEATLPESLPFDDIDLCVILSNLLENALEAALTIPTDERWISVRIRCKMNHFGVAVDNAFDGKAKTQDGRFLSGKRNGSEGVGLQSVRAVCGKNGGSTEFCVREDDVFHSEVLLPLKRKEGDEHENRNL